ncbi:hypothetical protein [Nocardia sp. NPDC049707]|uniref:hypothetical protein n=1 Tax=Nocardia sp. NPDC049707 TaxID=3154735 RepID=UPI00343E4DB8
MTSLEGKGMGSDDEHAELSVLIKRANSQLPQRDPFLGPPGTYSGAPGDVVELFAEAVREWAHLPATGVSSRRRGVESSGIGEREPPEGRVMALGEPRAKLCPRCTYEDAEPDTGICRYCTADIERAGDAIVLALRDANARTDRPAGWLQYIDGSWAPVDDHGFIGRTFAVALDDRHDFDEHAVIRVEPISIGDAEVE